MDTRVPLPFALDIPFAQAPGARATGTFKLLRALWRGDAIS
jgi:hypothetical protein